MTSKERAYLKSLAMNEKATHQIGKDGITPEFTEAIREALESRELVKVSILQNCFDDPRELADTLAGRTNSQVVQIIGRKIVLYKQNKDPKKRRITFGARKEDQ